jgi:hypothetical protein
MAIAATELLCSYQHTALKLLQPIRLRQVKLTEEINKNSMQPKGEQNS